MVPSKLYRTKYIYAQMNTHRTVKSNKETEIVSLAISSCELSKLNKIYYHRKLSEDTPFITTP